MLISRLSRKRCKVVNKVKRWRMRRIRDHTQKPTRLTKTVVVHIRSYVAMMTNIVNQFKCIEVKTLFTNLWKRCSKRLNTAKLLLRNVSTNHWLLLRMTNNALELGMGVTFVVKSMTRKTFALETIVTLLENLGAQLIKSVT